MGKRRDVYRILVGNPKKKRPLGRSRFLLGNVIKMDPQQVEMGTWSGLKWLWIGSGCGKF
jgi:hypothetical protein